MSKCGIGNNSNTKAIQNTATNAHKVKRSILACFICFYDYSWDNSKCFNFDDDSSLSRVCIDIATTTTLSMTETIKSRVKWQRKDDEEKRHLYNTSCCFSRFSGTQKYWRVACVVSYLSNWLMISQFPLECAAHAYISTATNFTKCRSTSFNSSKRSTLLFTSHSSSRKLKSMRKPLSFNDRKKNEKKKIRKKRTKINSHFDWNEWNRRRSHFLPSDVWRL